jgi:hypothetical protein
VRSSFSLNFLKSKLEVRVSGKNPGHKGFGVSKGTNNRKIEKIKHDELSFNRFL